MSRFGSGNANSFTDIHAATDGKLFKYGIRTRFSDYDKKRLIGCLIELTEERADPEVKPFGVRGLQIIQADCGLAPNFQAVDQILADDVLVDIAAMLIEISDEEIVTGAINTLAEQFKDMITTNGLCPSGRCNRAYNVYTFLRDFLDGIGPSK